MQTINFDELPVIRVKPLRIPKTDKKAVERRKKIERHQEIMRKKRLREIF